LAIVLRMPVIFTRSLGCHRALRSRELSLLVRGKLEAVGDEYHRALVMSDYHNWALLFIGAWFLSGAIPSAAVVRIFFAPKAGKGRD
jgi:hypothetical protein